jgi:protein-disulfide isomerase
MAFMLRTHRLVFAGSIAAALAVSGAFALAWSGGAPSSDAPPRATAVAAKDEQSAARISAELMKPGPLPELALGNDDAPVTIVEYADLTCPHCAAFNREVLPRLREKYIDTGKVRLLFREFPLNTHSLIAFMSVRCVAPEQAHGLIAALFEHQDNWGESRSMPELSGKLFALGQETGLTREAFDACVPSGDELSTDRQKQLVKDIGAVRNRASKALGVDSTPTLFVNGQKLHGASFEDVDKAVGAALNR